MFGIGTSELILIAIIVFLIYGPEKLPEVIRKVTRFTRDVKNASEQVTGVIRREVRNMEIMAEHPEEHGHDHEKTETVTIDHQPKDSSSDPQE